MSISTLQNAVKAQAKSGRMILASMLFVAAAAFNVVALPSAAGATSPQAPASKEECKNGGWEALGFRNQGQCIKAVVSAGGGGYAGGNHASFNGDVIVDVSGDDNTVTVIVNVIAGRP